MFPNFSETDVRQSFAETNRLLTKPLISLETRKETHAQRQQ